ncbi:hypothetical protein BGX27_009099 [Mortierella sp. AM989]|nr:hypothetical protein BGX27_009099 [Mortierella sp. AM989]
MSRKQKVRQFRNSEWGQEANNAMLKELEDMTCPWGGTMGEIFDATPKDCISKIFLEEKLFKTWYHGRTVLISDGAANAIQDSVVLANYFFNMPNRTIEGITVALEDYYKQRYHRVEMQIERSRSISKIMGVQSRNERLIRHFTLNYLPNWVQQLNVARIMKYRPQIAWLPLVENRGSGRVLP